MRRSRSRWSIWLVALIVAVGLSAIPILLGSFGIGIQWTGPRP
jgi:hypothetical protein